MSQEQQERVQQVQQREQVEVSRDKEIHNSGVSPESDAPATPDKEKNRVKKKPREIWVNAADISPHPSVWPVLLALAVSVLLLGLIMNVVMLIVGAVLVIATLIGWVLERR